jgi:hypothetical protein
VRQDVEKVASWVRIPERPVGFLGHFFRSPPHGASPGNIRSAMDTALAGEVGIEHRFINGQTRLVLVRVSARQS